MTSKPAHPRTSTNRRRLFATTTFSAGACLVLAACGAHAGSSGAEADGTWKPTEAVTIVVGAGPGGGFDQAARLVQQAAQDTGIVDVPINLQYQEGVGGTVALRTINQYKGDGHYLAVLGVSPVAIELTGQAAAPVTETTPLVRLYDEPLLFAVQAGSDIDSAETLIARLRENPSSVTIGISTSLGNHNHMAIAMVAQEAGIEPSDLKVVVFDSGNKTTNALLSGDVDLVPAPANSFIQLVEAGEVEGIAVSTPERLDEHFPEVPTWLDAGLTEDATFSNWRGLAGPADLSDAQVAYWDETLQELWESEELQAALAEIGASDAYLPFEEFQTWLPEQTETYRETLTSLNIL